MTSKLIRQYIPLIESAAAQDNIQFKNCNNSARQEHDIVCMIIMIYVLHVMNISKSSLHVFISHFLLLHVVGESKI